MLTPKQHNVLSYASTLLIMPFVCSLTDGDVCREHPKATILWSLHVSFQENPIALVLSLTTNI